MMRDKKRKEKKKLLPRLLSGLLTGRGPLALDTVLQNPGVLLHVVQRQALVGVEDEQL